MKRRIFWLAVLLCSAIQVTYTQNAAPQVTSTFAITNANVVVRPGQLQKGSTVIIKDGLIDRVGLNISIPIDAEIIEADSMFVYSGFIAGLSHAGIAKKEETRGSSPQARPPAHNPTNKQAGITPDLKSSDLVDPNEKSIKALRDEGFTIAHTIPRGRMLAGQGSVILLAGPNADAMLIDDSASLAGSFATANRVYPATTIGVISKWRELFNQAKLAEQHEKKFKASPAGMKRPSYDKAIKALYPAASKQVPIFFNTPKVLDLHRAMSLQKELGFNMVATNLKQGWKSIDKIKANNLGVVLSLDLPKEAKKEKKKKDADSIDEEMKALKEKSKQAKKEYVAQAASFGKSNVPFSLSITDVKVADISKNLKRMVKEGLSEDQALAALTTNPARLLGIQSMAGTIEKGKLANIIVSDTSYFKEKAKIKYVFVEGVKFEKEEKKTEKKSGEVNTAMVGKWDIEINADDLETITGTLNIEKDGDDYAGTISAENEETKIDDITVDGDELTISFMRDIDGSTLPIKGTFTVDKNDLTGSFNIGNGMISADVSGTKQTPEF